MRNALFIIIFLSVAQTLIFIGHWTLYKTVIHFLELGQTAVFSLRVVLFILSISFILSSVLMFFFYDLVSRASYYISAAWLGIFWYLFVFCLLIWVIYFLGQFIGFEPGRAVAAILLAVGAFLGIYGIINASSLKVTEYDISMNSPELKGKTAVWMSDTHFGAIRGEDFAKKIAGEIKRIDPDIFFMGGDFFDGTKVDFNKVSAPFSEINPPMGKFFITGNHEEFDGPNRFVEPLSKAGFTVLDNELAVANGIQIIGVDYKASSQKEDYDVILKGLQIDKNKPVILLRHVPDYLDIAQKYGVDLQISGHVHHGQMFPFMAITSVMFNGYNYGLKNYQNMKVLVSSGAGTWGPPLRVGTKAEIVKINFK